MDVSVIIPVYNDEKRVAGCIASVMAQKTDFSYEVIVVDDSSSDKTSSILKGIESIIILRNNNNSGQSYSRNRGALTAKGKYLFFVDSDVLLPDDAMSSACSFMLTNTDQRIKGVQGTFIINRQSTNWPSALYNALQYLLTESPGLSHNINSSCFLIDKNTFFQLGSFDENIWYMEDNQLGMRAAARGVLFKRNLTFFKHAKYLDFAWLFKQHFLGGVQYFNLRKNFPIKVNTSKEYSNVYFENILKKIFFFTALSVISFFYPFVAFILPLFIFTYAKTIRCLYKASGNIFFVICGFFILNMIAIDIALGYLLARICNTKLNTLDRSAWLSSNLRAG